MRCIDLGFELERSLVLVVKFLLLLEVHLDLLLHPDLVVLEENLLVVDHFQVVVL